MKNNSQEKIKMFKEFIKNSNFSRKTEIENELVKLQIKNFKMKHCKSLDQDCSSN